MERGKKERGGEGDEEEKRVRKRNGKGREG